MDRSKKMMNCKEVVDLLSDYLVNELSEQDVSGVRAHLKGCGNCKTLLASLKTTIKWTRNLKAEHIPIEAADSLLIFLRSKIQPNRTAPGRKK